MRPWGVAAGSAGIVGVVVFQAQLAGQPVQLDTLLNRATRYVGEFVYRFSNVVAEERYVQEAITNRMARPGPLTGATATALTTSGSRRELKSDFLLVLLPGSDEFLPFRDVFEVDGSLVRDREQRLTKLFLESAPTALDQAVRISNESARYNVGNLARTFNNPIIALAFLQPANRKRFRYSLGKQDRTAGPDVWIVEYRELERPTIIKGLHGRDIPARGEFWIDADTGRVIRSSLTLNDPAVLATLTTTYRLDERFRIDVPVEMREQYTYGGTRVTGSATYSRFRRFDVSTDEEMKSVSPAGAMTERRSGIRLIEIPAGSFTMGSPPAEQGRTDAEPQHDVAIPAPFFLGEHEVTQQEWRVLMGENPSRHADCGPRCPVETVSFDDVQRFLAVLNTGPAAPEYVFRLPTEAEWEYACRAGTRTPFSTGSTITTLQANFDGRQPYGGGAPGLFRERTTRASGFAPNAWGLADLHGNVAEWTADWLEADATDRVDRTLTGSRQRAVRGGSWASSAGSIRCAARSGAPGTTREPRIGFRIAADRIGRTP
jgi:formylglycine-generating enzyme required for sulfatase activity